MIIFQSKQALVQYDWFVQFCRQPIRSQTMELLLPTLSLHWNWLWDALVSDLHLNNRSDTLSGEMGGPHIYWGGVVPLALSGYWWDILINRKTRILRSYLDSLSSNLRFFCLEISAYLFISCLTYLLVGCLYSNETLYACGKWFPNNITNIFFFIQTHH